MVTETRISKIATLMSDGQWRTLAGIRAVCGGSPLSVGAILRDLRKPRHGYKVESKYAGLVDGKRIFEYRVSRLPREMTDDELIIGTTTMGVITGRI